MPLHDLMPLHDVRSRWAGISILRTALVLSGVTLCGPGTAFGQEPGPVGLVMGLPASVGVIWHLGERLAVRPELSLSWSSAESTTPSAGGAITSSTDAAQIGVGSSVILYVRQWDGLRLYVSPRFVYLRSETTATSGQSTSTTYSGSGSFGAQYSLGRRAGVFGELGLSYTRLRTSSDFVASAESRGTLVRTRSSVGLIVYF